ELEDRIVGDPVPVDQLRHHVLVGAKRQQARDDLDGLLEVSWAVLPLPRLGGVVAGDGAIARGRHEALVRRPWRGQSPFLPDRRAPGPSRSAPTSRRRRCETATRPSRPGWAPGGVLGGASTAASG